MIFQVGLAKDLRYLEEAQNLTFAIIGINSQDLGNMKNQINLMLRLKKGRGKLWVSVGT